MLALLASDIQMHWVWCILGTGFGQKAVLRSHVVELGELITHG